MSVSVVPNEVTRHELVVWIISSQIYEQNNINFDPSIINCKPKCIAALHIVNRIFFTNQNVAGPIELRLQDGPSVLIKTLSHFLIRQFA